MSILIDRRARRTPWHLWLVGFLAVLWNGVGATDYFLTQTDNAQYLERFSPEQLAYVDRFPVWVDACWAIGVWGGVLGALLLLLRRRLAVWFLFASFLAAVATQIYVYGLSEGMDVAGDPLSLGLSAAVVVIGFALFLYAGIMNRNNLLR